MKTHFALAGLYNAQNLKWFESIGHTNFELDLRPRSFQFLPHYQAHDLMAQADSRSQFRIHFQNEHELLVQKFIDDCTCKNVTYLFSGERDTTTVKKIKRSFYIEVGNESKDLLESVLQSGNENFKGLVIDYAHLHYELMNSRISNLLSSLEKLRVGGEIELGLRLKFNEDIAPSVWDIFNFDFYSIELSSHVELGYRQFSKELFISEFSKLTSLYPELNVR